MVEEQKKFLEGTETENSNNEASWSEITTTNYVKIEPDTSKLLLITNHQLRHTTKFDNEDKIEFVADVLAEDGETVSKKTFATVSKPLLIKLAPIMEKKASSDKVALQIIRVGKGKTTTYIVNEVGQ